MRKWLLKLLRVPDFKKQVGELQKQISDLNTTINTLKDEATHTYRVYEQAMSIINKLDLHKTPDWFNDMRYTTGESRMILYNIERKCQIDFARKKPSLKTKITFHGHCHGCVTPLEKGIGICTNCRYTNTIYPDQKTTNETPNT